jgi:hypothetical protein
MVKNTVSILTRSAGISVNYKRSNVRREIQKREQSAGKHRNPIRYYSKYIPSAPDILVYLNILSFKKESSLFKS